MADRAAPTHPSALVRGVLPVFAAAVLWGTTGTVSSFAPPGTSAAAIGAASVTFGGLLMFLGSRGAWTLPARCAPRERWLLLLGAVAVAGYPLTFYPAVARTGVAVATVVALGSAPVFAGLLSWLVEGVRPRPAWLVATGASVTGCAMLVLGQHAGDTRSEGELVGVGLAALAGLSYAGYSLIGGRLIQHGHPSGAVMGLMFGGAGLLALPVLVAGGSEWLAEPRGAAVATYLALCPTVLAYALFGYGLRHTTAAVATTVTLAEPAVAAVLGVTVVGERLSAVSWWGLGVLVAGLAVLSAGARDSGGGRSTAAAGGGAPPGPPV